MTPLLVPWLTVLEFDGWRWDEQLAASVLVAALAAIAWAFAYTTAEGALPLQRHLLRRGADALAVVAAYLVVRIWT